MVEPTNLRRVCADKQFRATAAAMSRDRPGAATQRFGKLQVNTMTVLLKTPISKSPALYDIDIVAWAEQQARLLRAGQFAGLDIEHIAEEIEDVGKSEQRELASRLSVLLAHLLKWQYQPERRGSSWLCTIRAQRRSLAIRLQRTPSLRATLRDAAWLDEIWQDAVSTAAGETGLDAFPDDCPWALAQVLAPDWMPE
jgi:hypothetical protein